MNCSETNVGKVQEVWDEAEYVNATGEQRGERVLREKLIGKRCTINQCMLKTKMLTCSAVPKKSMMCCYIK